MNFVQLLKLTKEVTDEIDVRAFLNFCRKVDIMTLLQVPTTEDKQQVAHWLKTWKAAYAVLSNMKLDGLEERAYFWKALTFLGAACNDKALFEEFFLSLASILEGEDDKYAISAANASDIVTRRMKHFETNPEAVLLSVQHLMAMSRVEDAPEPLPAVPSPAEPEEPALETEA